MSKILTSKGTLTLIIPPTAKSNNDGETYLTCPICTPGRKPEHKNDKLLAVNILKKPMPWRCNHCGEAGYVVEEKEISVMRIKPVSKEISFSDLDPKIIAWFENRMISKATLDYFKISTSTEVIRMNKTTQELVSFKGKLLQRICVAFKYFKDGALINVKYRDSVKNFKLIQDASLIFYNLDSIKDSKECVIVEGEPDCLSYHEAGYLPVISVPNGATITKEETEHFNKTGIMSIRSAINMEYLDLCLEDLAHIETFYIGTDDDPAGIKLRHELARRLGFERCKYIKYSEWKKPNNTPCKDANEVLCNHGKQAVLSTISTAIEFPIEGVNNASKYFDILMKNYDNGRERGLSTGYESIDPHFNWMRGWLTVVNGFPGNGKTSLLLNLIIISTILYKWKWGIYSPENYPVENIIDTLAEILTGNTSDIEFNNRISRKDYEKVIKDHIEKHIFFVDREDGYTPEDLREIKRQMIRKYGIEGFLTDPWSTLNHPSEVAIDRYIEKQLNAETRLATKYSLINLIAHHPPTPKDRTKVTPPTSFDLIGGQVWFNKAYALLCIHKQSDSVSETLANVYVQKIKEQKLAGHPTDSEHFITLKYERRTNRFLERQDITNNTSPFVSYPIKNYGEYDQTSIEGF